MCPLLQLVFTKFRCCGGARRANYKVEADISDMSTEESSPAPPVPQSGNSGQSDDDMNKQGSVFTLPEFVKHVKELGSRGLLNEFNKIKTDNSELRKFSVSRQPWNVRKNRYVDIPCLDDTRVVLSSEGGYGTDYINANYVDGYKQEKAFISTQGPLPETFGSFWRMVWEQKSLIIVMTTALMEKGVIKCGQYWPPEQGSAVMYEGFKIENLHVESQPVFRLTKLGLTNTKTGETRNVSHLHFPSWVDYSAPSSADGMLKFLEAMRTEQSNRLEDLESGKWEGHALGPPIVVHCSAGVGRTGALCTIDININRLNDNGTVDVKGTVEKIRSQRAKSVQFPEQYIFCHQAIIEYARSKCLLSDFESDEIRNVLQPPVV